MSVHWDVPKDKLDPEFCADVDKLLSDSPFAWVVTYGLRTCAEQKALWEQGRTKPGEIVTNSPPGESAHEFGFAIDVALLVDGRESWDTSHPAWPWLWSAVRQHPRLHSGHDFPPVAPADDDHVQSLAWYKKREELHASGQWGKSDC